MSSNVRVVPHQQAALQFSAVTVAGQPTDKEKSKIAKVEKKLALDVPEADADAAAVKSDGHKSEEEVGSRMRPFQWHALTPRFRKQHRKQRGNAGSRYLEQILAE